jgi:ABC-type cobalamin/Fe3+-siderophores transport system ATPase subunit
MTDFNSMVNRLFAEDNAADSAYVAKVRSRGAPLMEMPEQTTLRKVEQIWNSIFTERELVIDRENYVISARQTLEHNAYPALFLSDGERVGFYLIGQVLLAEQEIILIDEPEIHIHQAMQAALWDALEAARPECDFIYLTHDLTFAASRVGAPKVILYSYKPKTPTFTAAGGITYSMGPQSDGIWTWDLLPSGMEVPDDVVMRIAGSRRRTIFTEGHRGSLDEQIFSAAYPKFNIVPSHNCESVIRTVQAFATMDSLHREEVYGIVDLDDRDPAEVAGLREIGVHALPVAGVENLLLLPEVLDAVAAAVHLTGSDKAVAVHNAKNRAVQHLRTARAATVLQRAQYAVERQLHKITPLGRGKADLIEAVAMSVAAADPGTRYDEAEAQISAALSHTGVDEQYVATLMVFRNKGLIPLVAQMLKLSSEAYERIALGLLRDPGSPVAIGITNILPKL